MATVLKPSREMKNDSLISLNTIREKMSVTMTSGLPWVTVVDYADKIKLFLKILSRVYMQNPESGNLASVA